MPAQIPDKSALVGAGYTSDVYAWGEGRVLKLYHAGVAAARVQREFTVTRVIREAGLGAPAVYDLVELDGRLGIVFERIEGPSLVNLVQARPWKLFSVARQFAELHAELHSRPGAADLPRLDQQIDGALQAGVQLSESEKQALRARLANLPQGDALCHGDFHPGNILCTNSGSIIIDWGRANRGPPLADVARTSFLFQHAELPPTTPRAFRLLFESLRSLLHRTYLKRYLQLRPGTPEQIAAWKTALASLSWNRELEALSGITMNSLAR